MRKAELWQPLSAWAGLRARGGGGPPPLRLPPGEWPRRGRSSRVSSDVASKGGAPAASPAPRAASSSQAGAHTADPPTDLAGAPRDS